MGFVEVDGEVFVADLVEFDGYPTLYADVGGAEVGARGALDERGLRTGLGRNVYGDVAVLVMIIGEHAEDLFAGEEGGLAMGELLGGFGEAEAESTDATDLFFVHFVILQFAYVHHCPRVNRTRVAFFRRGRPKLCAD